MQCCKCNSACILYANSKICVNFKQVQISHFNLCMFIDDYCIQFSKRMCCSLPCNILKASTYYILAMH